MTQGVLSHKKTWSKGHKNSVSQPWFLAKRITLQNRFKLYFKRAILVYIYEFGANLSYLTQKCLFFPWDDRQMFVNESKPVVISTFL